MIDASKLVDLLGHAYGSEQFKTRLKQLGIRNTNPDNDPFYGSEFIWHKKQALRFDLFTPNYFLENTKKAPYSEGERIFASLDIMDTGYMDAVTSCFEGILPYGLSMKSNPTESQNLLGAADLKETLEWPGYSGRLLAWVKGDKNVSLQFHSTEKNTSIRCMNICIRGAETTWATTWPEIFGAN